MVFVPVALRWDRVFFWVLCDTRAFSERSVLETVGVNRNVKLA